MYLRMIEGRIVSSMNMADSVSGEEAFTCRLCGHCCRGRGGIVVAEQDLARLCEFLAMTPQEFEQAYGERRSGKLHVRPGEDGLCIFFKEDQGCAVHPAKPRICKAWPYFRGNLLDEESLTLAKDFCPGIPQEQCHADFVHEGLAYLAREGLIGTQSPDEPRALYVLDILTNRPI